MPWLGPLVSVVGALAGVYSAVNSGISSERSEDLANEQYRTQKEQGARSLLEQQNYNKSQLGIQQKQLDLQKESSTGMLGGADNLLDSMPISSADSSIQNTSSGGEYLPGASQILGNQQPNVYSWN